MQSLIVLLLVSFRFATKEQQQQFVKLAYVAVQFWEIQMMMMRIAPFTVAAAW